MVFMLGVRQCIADFCRVDDAPGPDNPKSKKNPHVPISKTDPPGANAILAREQERREHMRQRHRNPYPMHTWTPREEDANKTEGSESIEVLRTRHPLPTPSPLATTILVPPPLRDTPRQIAWEAGHTAMTGVSRAMDEIEPELIAARAIMGIAVAVSTARSYAAFVAAVTAAESYAIQLSEMNHENLNVARGSVRIGNALETAVQRAMAASASGDPSSASSGWPKEENTTQATPRALDDSTTTVLDDWPDEHITTPTVKSSSTIAEEGWTILD